MSEIWTPDIELWNLEEGLKGSFDDAYAVLSNDGSIFWSRPGHLRPVCKFEGLRRFPFDYLTCTLEFGSWAYNGKFLRPVRGIGGGFSFGGSLTSGESFNEFSWANDTKNREPIKCWEHVYPPYPEDTEEDWPVLMYNVTVKRAYQPYVRGYITLQILLNVAGFSAFWLPPSCGERMGLSITAMLASVASEVVVADTLPAAPEYTWFQKFSLLSLSFAFVSLLECVAVLYFYYKRSETLIPWWLDEVRKRFALRRGRPAFVPNISGRLHGGTAGGLGVQKVGASANGPRSPGQGRSSCDVVDGGGANGGILRPSLSSRGRGCDSETSPFRQVGTARQEGSGSTRPLAKRVSFQPGKINGMMNWNFEDDDKDSWNLPKPKELEGRVPGTIVEDATGGNDGEGTDAKRASFRMDSTHGVPSPEHNGLRAEKVDKAAGMSKGLAELANLDNGVVIEDVTEEDEEESPDRLSATDEAEPVEGDHKDSKPDGKIRTKDGRKLLESSINTEELLAFDSDHMDSTESHSADLGFILTKGNSTKTMSSLSLDGDPSDAKVNKPNPSMYKRGLSSGLNSEKISQDSSQQRPLSFSLTPQVSSRENVAPRLTLDHRDSRRKTMEQYGRQNASMRSMAVVAAKDADDFNNEEEVEHNLFWKAYAAKIDDMARFWIPLAFCISLAIILAEVM